MKRTSVTRSAPPAPVQVTDYAPFLESLKSRIRQAQVRAALSVNREMVLLYWNIGQQILAAQSAQGWGTKVIEALSADLTRSFPEMKGFSPRNLKYMRAFAEAWPDEAIVQQLVAQLPWGHNVRILDQLDMPSERQWYAERALEFGWSRNILMMQIKSKLHERQGAAVTNFAATLPKPQSDLVQNLLKDPYCFDFLSLGQEAEERDIEQALITHIRKFMLELGAGFAFVGQQVPIEVGGEDFYMDLLFYHVRMHCYVVIELKTGKFKPEYAGKLNFYLSAVDDLLRTPGDAPTIGMVLCQDKNQVVAEYALRDMEKPMGVSIYHIHEALPKAMQGILPSIERLEAALSASFNPTTLNTLQ